MNLLGSFTWDVCVSLIYYITFTAADKAWERHAIKPALTVLLCPGNVILWKLNRVSTRHDQLRLVLAGKEDTAADTHRLESCRLFLGVYFGLWRWWCGVSGLQTVSCTAAGKCDHLISHFQQVPLQGRRRRAVAYLLCSTMYNVTWLWGLFVPKWC